METAETMSTRMRRSGLLYPMLVIAAIAVTVFSAVGIATMMGWMPSALSGSEPAARPAVTDARSSASFPHVPSVASRKSSARATCIDCGVIESVRALEVPGQSSWMGAGGGALVGGLLGNQIGSGGGRAAATVAGAAGGAYAGTQVEKHVNKSVQYQVRVRMEDGSYRTFTDPSRPGFAAGQKVRVTDRGIVAGG